MWTIIALLIKDCKAVVKSGNKNYLFQYAFTPPLKKIIPANMVEQVIIDGNFEESSGTNFENEEQLLLYFSNLLEKVKSKITADPTETYRKFIKNLSPKQLSLFVKKIEREYLNEKKYFDAINLITFLLNELDFTNPEVAKLSSLLKQQFLLARIGLGGEENQQDIDIGKFRVIAERKSKVSNIKSVRIRFTSNNCVIVGAGKVSETFLLNGKQKNVVLTRLEGEKAHFSGTRIAFSASSKKHSSPSPKKYYKYINSISKEAQKK